ncbi:MAG: haloacid dehalogenase type II [Vicinamibacterales bacterium]
MPRVLVFDVNETLLDVRALDPIFEDLFGDAAARRDWFSTLLLYSEVATLAGPFDDFGAIAAAALAMTAERRGVAISDEAGVQVLDGMRRLPPHPDVEPGLRRLRDEGFRLVALSNSSHAMLHAQLAHAGLAGWFERLFSVDAVRRFKPAPEPYELVARELGLGTDRLRMVAAHAWDVIGAMRAGCRAAFVARPGAVWYPLAPLPDVVAPDVAAIAERIVAVERATP